MFPDEAELLFPPFTYLSKSTTHEVEQCGVKRFIKLDATVSTARPDLAGLDLGDCTAMPGQVVPEQILGAEEEVDSYTCTLPRLQSGIEKLVSWLDDNDDHEVSCVRHLLEKDFSRLNMVSKFANDCGFQGLQPHFDAIAGQLELIISDGLPHLTHREGCGCQCLPCNRGRAPPLDIGTSRAQISRKIEEIFEQADAHMPCTSLTNRQARSFWAKHFGAKDHIQFDGNGRDILVQRLREELERHRGSTPYNLPDLSCSVLRTKLFCRLVGLEDLAKEQHQTFISIAEFQSFTKDDGIVGAIAKLSLEIEQEQQDLFVICRNIEDIEARRVWWGSFSELERCDPHVSKECARKSLFKRSLSTIGKKSHLINGSKQLSDALLELFCDILASNSNPNGEYVMFSVFNEQVKIGLYDGILACTRTFQAEEQQARERAREQAAAEAKSAAQPKHLELRSQNEPLLPRDQLSLSGWKGGTFDFQIKIVLVGEAGVGKTSLMAWYVDGCKLPTYMPTIGIDFKIKCMSLDDGTRVKLQLWDTAGQERFRSITSAYLRGATVIIVVYDCANRSSYQQAGNWLRRIDETTDCGVLMVLGNKSDTDERQVSESEGEGLVLELRANASRELRLRFSETSARNGSNVQGAFEWVAAQAVDKARQERKLLPQRTAVKVNAIGRKKGNCC
jgi:small GTP-binding protein